MDGLIEKIKKLDELITAVTKLTGKITLLVLALAELIRIIYHMKG
ncbi:hypothetical protein [Clostridium botulinum]|nr:hypothetical protein [Clostridium botulinum]